MIFLISIAFIFFNMIKLRKREREKYVFRHVTSVGLPITNQTSDLRILRPDALSKFKLKLSHFMLRMFQR